MSESTEQNYTVATLCFLVRGGEVLLAEKQKKIGAGFLNGFGGKAEPGDADIYDTNAREVEEEVGVKITTARKVGEILFHNPSDDDTLRKMTVHIFIATEWANEPVDTEEMKNVSWHRVSELDYDLFLSADRLFMPQILNGKNIRGVISYNKDWSVRSSQLKEVESF